VLGDGERLVEARPGRTSLGDISRSRFVRACGGRLPCRNRNFPSAGRAPADVASIGESRASAGAHGQERRSWRATRSSAPRGNRGRGPAGRRGSNRTTQRYFRSGPVCSSVVTPGGRSMIRMLRKWISPPSDSRSGLDKGGAQRRLPEVTSAYSDSPAASLSTGRSITTTSWPRSSAREPPDASTTRCHPLRESIRKCHLSRADSSRRKHDERRCCERGDERQHRKSLRLHDHAR
jgi:hypothetical protein